MADQTTKVKPTTKAKKAPEALEALSPEEAQQLKLIRESKAKRQACALEIDEILKKNNAILVIDPNSAFGSPQIIVSLR